MAAKTKTAKILATMPTELRRVPKTPSEKKRNAGSTCSMKQPMTVHDDDDDNVDDNDD